MEFLCDISDKEKWLSLRKLGASEAAAIRGLSPWKSKSRLWAELVGWAETSDLSTNEAVEAGTRLERTILEWYGDETERCIEISPGLFAHDDYDFITATPDAFVIRPRELLGVCVEAKNVSNFMLDEWERSGAPLHYWLQVQHQLLVTGASMGSFAVLFGGQYFRWFDVERDDAEIARHLEALIAFWDNVEREEPPDDNNRGKADLASIIEPDGEIKLGVEWIEPHDRLEAIKSGINRLNKRRGAIEDAIKAEMGSAEIARLPSGDLYSWKRNKNGSRIFRFKAKGE